MDTGTFLSYHEPRRGSLYIPAPPGAFEVEVNPYFSCDFALKHIEICHLGTYAAPFMYREPRNGLRRRKHIYMYAKQF